MPTIKASDEMATIGSFTPPGVIMPFGGRTPPNGWLICDGSEVSRTTYAALAAALWDSTTSKYAWGYGNNSTTFNLPDLRGRMLRGYDAPAFIGGAKANRDPDKAGRTATNSGNAGDNVGSVQDDRFQGHHHVKFPDASSGIPILGTGEASWPSPLWGNTSSTSYSTQVGIPKVDTLGNGTPRTTSETRPINANVNYIIKY